MLRQVNAHIGKSSIKKIPSKTCEWIKDNSEVLDLNISVLKYAELFFYYYQSSQGEICHIYIPLHLSEIYSYDCCSQTLWPLAGKQFHVWDVIKRSKRSNFSTVQSFMNHNFFPRSFLMHQLSREYCIVILRRGTNQWNTVYTVMR